MRRINLHSAHMQSRTHPENFAQAASELFRNLPECLTPELKKKDYPKASSEHKKLIQLYGDREVELKYISPEKAVIDDYPWTILGFLKLASQAIIEKRNLPCYVNELAPDEVSWTEADLEAWAGTILRAMGVGGDA